jgi:hypothetical protein
MRMIMRYLRVVSVQAAIETGYLLNKRRKCWRLGSNCFMINSEIINPLDIWAGDGPLQIRCQHMNNRQNIHVSGAISNPWSHCSSCPVQPIIQVLLITSIVIESTDCCPQNKIKNFTTSLQPLPFPYIVTISILCFSLRRCQYTNYIASNSWMTDLE